MSRKFQKSCPTKVYILMLLWYSLLSGLLKALKMLRNESKKRWHRLLFYYMSKYQLISLEFPKCQTLIPFGRLGCILIKLRNSYCLYKEVPQRKSRSPRQTDGPNWSKKCLETFWYHSDDVSKVSKVSDTHSMRGTWFCIVIIELYILSI